MGEFELHEDYKHLTVSHSDWSQMTAEQRKMKIDKLLKQSIKDDVSVPYEDHSSQTDTTLSVDWNNANITFLQPCRVKDCGPKLQNY